MLQLVCVSILLAYVPNASVVLRGIGIDCYPFYLDDETAEFRFSALRWAESSNLTVSRLYKKPDWMKYDFRTFVRLSAHFPRWSMVGIEGLYYEKGWHEYAEILLSHSMGIKRFGCSYSIGLRDFPELFEQKQYLVSSKVSYSPNSKFVINLGASYCRIEPEEGNVHRLLGPVFEARYCSMPLVVYLCSRHPEDFIELDSLELFHSNYLYDGFDYCYVPLEGGIGLVQTPANATTVVLGLKTRMRYMRQSTEVDTVEMIPQDIMFVSGCNYSISTNFSLRGGFMLDYFMDSGRTREIRYRQSMGGSFTIENRFVLDFSTANLGTPLDYNVAFQWFF